jgi:hypothetical protein
MVLKTPLIYKGPTRNMAQQAGIRLDWRGVFDTESEHGLLDRTDADTDAAESGLLLGIGSRRNLWPWVGRFNPEIQTVFDTQEPIVSRCVGHRIQLPSC